MGLRGSRARLTFLHVRGPEGKVISEQLHDEGRVPMSSAKDLQENLIAHLYDSSDRVSSSAIASSKACLARWQARSGLFKIS